MHGKRTRRILLGLTALVFLVVCATFLLPLPPYGRFLVPQIGSDADAYLELADGKVSLVVWTGESGRSGDQQRDLIGDYSWDHGQWVLTNRHSGVIAQLHATLVSLEIIETNGSRSGPYYRTLP
jgi:hypothetical protein